MNNIGFGIFCFGEDYYYRGTKEKIKQLLNVGLPNLSRPANVLTPEVILIQGARLVVNWIDCGVLVLTVFCLYFNCV